MRLNVPFSPLARFELRGVQDGATQYVAPQGPPPPPPPPRPRILDAAPQWWSPEPDVMDLTAPKFRTLAPRRQVTSGNRSALYPSQFNFVPTIDDTKFETLLLQHPDRALVRSFVHGFRSEGLEPEHDGSVASWDDSATLTFPRSEDHRSFIQTTIDDEVAKGWLSPGTAFPIPGATYSSVFVVESANHRMRVVADHTRSGPNDGISRAACPTVYDSIIDFIRLLRWHRVATSLLSANSVLWKLDVSSAFKVLVMSKDWQVDSIARAQCEPK
ncbi:BQ5605_C017g08482 [Microbotryum silenes-dioicae]|uniref:BQ5605_C017g08482 protein n=1 Tax=Microbotryum silenes-dioicae TaxID=796604 RepID=A0A2X0NYE4_9BASI|nr:BQ5605_C017g08482 [Microbotryum silenes-dioicae]